MNRRVRINTISPGATNTAMTEDFTSVAGIATPEDQANALLLINSSLSSYISGQDIQVDFAGATQYLFIKENDSMNPKIIKNVTVNASLSSDSKNFSSITLSGLFTTY
ncbi:hypothetical protein ACWHAM_21920 [Paenibacillus terrae]